MFFAHGASVQDTLYLSILYRFIEAVHQNGCIRYIIVVDKCYSDEKHVVDGR